MADRVKEGDAVRILQTDFAGANVLRGDVLKVVGRLSEGIFIIESPRSPHANGWWLADRSEGDGWERVDE